MTDHLSADEQRLARSIEAAYRPYVIAERLGSPRRRLGSWIAAAETLVTVLVVIGVALRPASALASWTAEPTTSDREALGPATEGACRDQAQLWIDRGRLAGWPEDAGLIDMARVPLVAFDQRGAASAALFADEGTTYICAIIPIPGPQPSYVELSGGTRMIAEDFGLIEVRAGGSGWNWDYGGRGEIAGRVDPHVRQATMILEDGTSVIATIDDGWFLAWWPSQASPVRIDLHAAGGEMLDSVDLGERYVTEPPCRIGLVGGICLWQSD